MAVLARSPQIVAVLDHHVRAFARRWNRDALEDVRWRVGVGAGRIDQNKFGGELKRGPNATGVAQGNMQAMQTGKGIVDDMPGGGDRATRGRVDPPYAPT